MSDTLFANLNDPQREAVQNIEGPLLILAGAGSGKTRVITHRIAHLVRDHGVPPWAILAVTFTNKAAQEMQERVVSLLGDRGRHCRVGTFHSTCAMLLRRYIDRLGYTSSFTIYDAQDQLGLVKQILKDLNINSERFTPGQFLGGISQAKQRMAGPDTFLFQNGSGYDPFREILSKVYAEYQTRLKRQNSVDFDDLLALTVRLFQEHPDIREEINQRWRYILVDEYQDTNLVQFLFLTLLTKTHDNICVVGDDDQSIYRWRGADITNILDFERRFPGAKVVKLEQNYRSTQTILAAAHDVIEKNKTRKEKKLWTDLGDGEPIDLYAAETERKEAQFVTEEILRQKASGERSNRDFAVFYRTNAQSRVLEEQLRTREIPYAIVGGVRFYERKEIKDILAYLRILDNPADDINLGRIINVPPRRIGQATLDTLARFAAEHDVSMLDAIRKSTGPGVYLFRSNVVSSLQGFINLVDEMAAFAQSNSLADLVEEILDRSGYMDMLQRQNDEESADREQNLSEFLNEVQEYEESQRGTEQPASLQGLLERVALQTDMDNWENKEDRVTLMSLHSAKGLEFDTVFLTGMEEELFPHSRSYDEEESMEEERRLCYVGITRAKRKLYLTRAMSRMQYGNTISRAPSRFLHDILPERIHDRSQPVRPVSSPMAANGGRFSSNGSAFPRSGKSSGGFNYEEESQEVRDDEPVFDADSGTLKVPLGPGVKVHHPSFGVGKVVDMEGQGDDAKCTVLFPGRPMKRIVAKFLTTV